MKISILTLLIVVGAADIASADQDHVECPGTPGSPYYEYPDIGVCARYDNGTACPTGFTGMAPESNEGYGLDGWACFCQTGYTSPTTGACVYAPVNPGYTDCDRDWERNFSDVPPSPVFIGVCSPDCDYWGGTCDDADWVHNDNQIWVGPDMLMWIDRDDERMVVYDQYPDYNMCGLIGWIWDASTSSCVRACDHPGLNYGASEDIPCPNAGIGWFHFGWSLTPP
jgi:hypothetical protein